MAVRMSALRAGRRLTPGRFLVLISVRGWVDTRVIVRLQRLGQLKNPMTLGDVISLILFFQNKESRLKIVFWFKQRHTFNRVTNVMYVHASYIRERQRITKTVVRVRIFFTIVCVLKYSYFIKKVKFCCVIKTWGVPRVGGHTLREWKQLLEYRLAYSNRRDSEKRRFLPRAH
jgi:hypothetical protein